jgi:Raf kinase inhibitor-like YbhB/YbcL family protein
MKLNLGTLAVTSSAFNHGTRIPERYTSAGDGISPPLSWRDPPAATRSLALFSHDPDAPLTYGFDHWVLYGIPPDVSALTEGDDRGYVAGTNGAGAPGYFPPTPPPGHGDHFYYFHLYALDATLDLEPGLDGRALLARIDGHIIEQARIVGIHRSA